MDIYTGDLHANKYVLLWPMSVPDEVRALFTMAFMDISGLIRYVCQVLTQTDRFYLIIPLNCLGNLLKDRVYEFPQIVHIDIICDSIRDLQQIETWFQYGFEKLKFWVIDDLLKLWEEAKLNRTLILTDSIDTNITNAIGSLKKAYISAKHPDIYLRRSHIQKQFASTSLHGFPVENSTNFPSCCICPSCKLVYGQPHQLECGHRLCHICVKTRINCVKCSKAVSRDKSSVIQKMQMNMQNVCIRCSYCDWKQPLREYEAHLKENHDEKITCFVGNRQFGKQMKVMSLNGGCIWEVSNIDQIKNDATSDKQYSVYSEAFYLYPQGYKLCMRLYMNGDHKARGRCMSLFVAMMRGDDDDKLQWPFQFKVTFTLIDQSVTGDNQPHINQFCCSDSTAKCFGRPYTDMNIACGIPMFIRLDHLEENRHRYIQNDRMFIKIEIDLLAQKPTSPMADGEGELPNDEEHVDTTSEDINAIIDCFDNSNDDFK